MIFINKKTKTTTTTSTTKTTTTTSMSTYVVRVYWRRWCVECLANRMLGPPLPSNTPVGFFHWVFPAKLRYERYHFTLAFKDFMEFSALCEQGTETWESWEVENFVFQRPMESQIVKKMWDNLRLSAEVTGSTSSVYDHWRLIYTDHIIGTKWNECSCFWLKLG